MDGRLNNKAKLVNPTSVLDEFIKGCPEITFSFGNASAYQRLRIVESHLVSCFDGQDSCDGKKLQILTISRSAEVLAVTSFGVFQNRKREEEKDLYARVDLVIAEKKWRGFGIGKAIVFSVLVYILRIYGKRLYSISCLAAHDAIAKILEELSFIGETRDTKGFKHERLDLEQIRYEDLLSKLEVQFPQVLNSVYHRIVKSYGV